MIMRRLTIMILLGFFVVLSNAVGVLIGYKIAENQYLNEKKESAIVNANLILGGLLLFKNDQPDYVVKYYQNVLCGYSLGVSDSFFSFEREHYLTKVMANINRYISTHSMSAEGCPTLKSN